LDLNVRKKLVKYYIGSTALYGAKTLIHWKADQKYLESFEMWYWKEGEDHLDRSCEKCISITKSKGGNKHPTYNTTKEANWIGHILCTNCLLKQVTEGRIRGKIAGINKIR
jgi:hypothetical protein